MSSRSAPTDPARILKGVKKGALLLGLVLLAVAACAEGVDAEEEPEPSPPLFDTGGLRFSDGTRVRLNVNGSLPPPCDPRLDSSLDAQTLACVDRECEVATFELEGVSIDLARTEGGIVIDPQLYEVDLFATPDDCVDDDS